jgi:hypothetical protein
MDSLARQIADDALQLGGVLGQQHVTREVQSFVASLGDVSADFARETSHYLVDAVARFGKN